MYTIAEMLWHMDSANLYIGAASENYWDNLSHERKHGWYMRAVQIINEAEPVWLRRTEQSRQKALAEAWEAGRIAGGQRVLEIEAWHQAGEGDQTPPAPENPYGA